MCWLQPEWVQDLLGAGAVSALRGPAGLWWAGRGGLQELVPWLLLPSPSQNAASSFLPWKA